MPFGSKLNLMADFVIICRNVFEGNPEVFIMLPKEVKSKLHEGIKAGRKSYWLGEKFYKKPKDKWDKIGEGF